MKNKTRRIIGRIAIILGCLIMLLFIASLYLKASIRNGIEEKLAAATSGGYHLQLGEINLNIFKMTVGIDNIAIISDSLNNETSKLPFISFEAASLNFSGIKYKKNEGLIALEFNNLEIVSPSVVIEVNDKKHSFPQEKLDIDFGYIRVSHLNVKDAQMTYRNISKEDRIETFFYGLNVEASSLVYDSREEEENRLDFSDVSFDLTKIRQERSLAMKTLSFDSLHINSKDSIVKLSLFESVPMHDKESYAYLNAKHLDWTKIVATNIECFKFDVKKFMQSQSLIVDSIIVGRFEIESFKNRKIARREWIKPMFHTELQNLNWDFDVKYVAIKNGMAVYEELAGDGITPGRVWFDKLHAGIDGLSNMNEEKNNRIAIHTHSYLMGQGALYATFEMPIYPDDNYFEVAATLNKMDMTDFSDIATNIAGAEVKSGRLQNVDLYIGGTESKAHIDMTMKYNRLEVGILKEKSLEADGKRFLTTIANFIVRSDNPDSKGLRKSHKEVERDEYRSPFNYLWKLIWAGTKDIIT